MTEASVSFAGNLTDDPEIRSTEAGIARAMFRVAVVGRLQQRSWTAEDGSARWVAEVVADELGPSLRWATATPVRATRSASYPTPQQRPVRGV
jgi:single-stranded DNA-binding protein